MKLKARKSCARMTDKDCPSKKRRKESSFWQRKREAAAALITSSRRKRRIESTALCLVSPSRVRVVPGVAETSLAGEDLCRNLHLTFASVDSPCAGLKDEIRSNLEVDEEKNQEVEHSAADRTEQEGTEVLLEVPKVQLDATGSSARPSLLETIFSPVFHLFKGHNDDMHLSCYTSGERKDGEDHQAVDIPDVSLGSWKSGYQDASAVTCPSLVNYSSKVINSLCRTELSDTFSTVEDTVGLKFSTSNGAVSLVDNGDCLEWAIDGKVGDHGDVLRPGGDQCQMDTDVLGSDAADLFLAVEESRSLECSDEANRERHIVHEEEEDFEDIDPYLFIKRLPSLSEVVSPCRPLLLPRQTRRSPPITLVLDLDETLVHSTLERCDDADFSFPVHFDHQEHMVYVRRRPHLQMFMERVAQLFEIIVFTASQSVYAEQLLNVLDPKRKLIRHRIFRDSCVFVRGNYLKDLTILGRDLSKVAIIDNSPQAYGFQVDNGIPIESWFDDRSDSALATLLPFLETLVGVDDVRPIIAKRYNLRQKIAAAADLPYIVNRGDPLDRYP